MRSWEPFRVTLQLATGRLDTFEHLPAPRSIRTASERYRAWPVRQVVLAGGVGSFQYCGPVSRFVVPHTGYASPDPTVTYINLPAGHAISCQIG